MNASVEWLNAFLDAPRSARDLRDLLTAHTATVEEMIALRADLAPIRDRLIAALGVGGDDA